MFMFLLVGRFVILALTQRPCLEYCFFLVRGSQPNASFVVSVMSFNMLETPLCSHEQTLVVVTIGHHRLIFVN